MNKSITCLRYSAPKAMAFPFTLVLAMMLLTGQALAQIRPAYVKNVDEPGRTPYQQMVVFNTSAPTCPLEAFCIVSFNPVPAGKRLIVEHVTVFIAVASGGEPNYLTFGDTSVTNSGNVAIVKPDFSISHNVGGSNFWALDRDALVYYEAGATPKLKIGATANFGFVGNASLHGYLIDAAN